MLIVVVIVLVAVVALVVVVVVAVVVVVVVAVVEISQEHRESNLPGTPGENNSQTHTSPKSTGIARVCSHKHWFISIHIGSAKGTAHAHSPIGDLETMPETAGRAQLRERDRSRAQSHRRPGNDA